MQIASQVYGIQTAANGLCFSPKGQSIYVTRRFDILPDRTKLPMEDFASLVSKNEQTIGSQFKYNGCYDDIAKAIRANVAAWIVEMERFYDMTAASIHDIHYLKDVRWQYHDCMMLGHKGYLSAEVKKNLFETVNITLEVPYRLNQKNWQPPSWAYK